MQLKNTVSIVLLTLTVFLGLDNACCGTSSYSTRSHICCDGQLQLKGKPAFSRSISKTVAHMYFDPNNNKQTEHSATCFFQVQTTPVAGPEATTLVPTSAAMDNCN